MKIVRLLQIQMALLACLAAIMLSLGQQSMFLAISMAAVALISLTLTDGLKVFQLHRYVANVAMLLAAFFSLNDFFQLEDSYQQLVAIGRLLVFVQMTLLLQQKTFRIYGQIAVFSLLQVVVAALINDGLAFGILLLVYTIVGVFGLSFFSLHRETSRTSAGDRRDPDDPTIRVVASSSPQELGNRILGCGVLWPITGVSIATVVFAAFFFYTTPRGNGSWREGGLRRNTMVGFNPEISFNEMGKILENDELVMRVTFRNHFSDEPYVIIGEPYYRGSVLTRYVIEDGRPKWKHDLRDSHIGDQLTRHPAGLRELVRQETFLEPTRDNLVFHVYPPYRVAATPSSMRYHRMNRQLFRDNPRRERQQFNYTLVTSAFRFGTQIPVTPHLNSQDDPAQAKEWAVYNRRCKHIFTSDWDEEERFPGLKRLADQIVANEPEDANNYDKAKVLESWFLEPRRFSYSLDFDEVNAMRNPNLDPVEDFVVNHRTGHCQYFASALALMLKSQGIPARVIAGYRGGEFNYVGNYYLVRQRDAHAWVEAFLPREQIPANTMDEAEIHSGGGWLRLDPTPARDDRPNQRSVVDRMTKSFDYAQWLWSDYVLRLTPQQQAMSMMDPKNPGNRLRFGVNAQRVQQKLNETLGQDGSHWTKSWAWVVFTSSMGLFLAGYLVYRWWRNPAKWQWFKFTRKAKTKPKKAIDFYMRMEKSLARLGLRRAPSQTQLEFATFAAEQLDASAKQAPLLVVSAFYDQRFGEHPIDDERSVLIDAALHELDIVSKRRR